MRFDFEILAIAMKMIIFKHLWRVVHQVPSLLGIFLTIFVTSSGMGVTVTTLTGGPSQANKKFFGYVDGDTKAEAQFHTPMGLAFDAGRTTLVVADRDNNVIRLLDLAGNLTTTFDITETNLLNRPVGVAVDMFNFVYILNAGDGNNGTLEVFDNFGDHWATLASDLVNASGIVKLKLYLPVESA